MKKFILLDQIELFLKENGRFTLADLMRHFHLSRSTALRYIASLEELGVPIYSEKGRNGGYIVSPTYRIDPIRFTESEIQAILFALDSMEVLKTSPFKLHFDNISKKLLHVLPVTGHQQYKKISQYVEIRNTQQIHPAAYLDKLLQAILENQYLSIVFDDEHQHIKPLALWFQSGKWLLAVFNLDLLDLRVLRCDQISQVLSLDAHFKVPDDLPDFDQIDLHNFTYLRQQDKHAQFNIKIQLAGQALFYSKQLPHIQLHCTSDYAVISGDYHEEETDYLLDYINRFYRFLINIEPASLKHQYAALVKHQLNTVISSMSDETEI